MIKNFTIFILSIFDYFYQKKIIAFLKKNFFITSVIDVGAHKGETVKLFCKNFDLISILCFEASVENFKILEKEIKKIFKFFPNTKIVTNNLALGKTAGKLDFYQTYESSSSTFNSINIKSKYYNQKKKLLGLHKNDNFFKISKINIITLDQYFANSNSNEISLLKIDTEGFEYEILQGAVKSLKKIKLVLLEHHYDDMIDKNYTFSDINQFLKTNSFINIFKAKMPFRKTFEYIFQNKDLS